MLFPYKYVPHKMEKMQEFIDFIFFEVWCKAPRSGPFGLNLFDGNADLREVMTEFYYSDRKNADFFYGNVERIYGHFSKLKIKQVRRLKWWYCSNNDVMRLCSHDSGCHATLYSDVARKTPGIESDIKKFFTGLYDFDAAALKKHVGDIDSHYKAFDQTNDLSKCPFCGINDIKGKHHKKREAYDHYLPKTLYPFNSINFRNLAPACHECNSSYKHGKDPAHGPTGRRRSFYPYAATGHIIELQVTLQHSNLDKLTPADITLQFGPSALNEKIDTWKDVYGIEERYKAKFCGTNGSKYWLMQVHDEWDNDGRLPADYLRTLARQTEKSPYADCNFLKKAFLDSCERAGILNQTLQYPNELPED